MLFETPQPREINWQLQKIDDWKIIGDVMMIADVKQIRDLKIKIIKSAAEADSLTIKLKKATSKTADSADIATKTITAAANSVADFGNVDVPAGGYLSLMVTNETGNVQAISVTGEII